MTLTLPALTALKKNVAPVVKTTFLTLHVPVDLTIMVQTRNAQIISYGQQGRRHEKTLPRITLLMVLCILLAPPMLIVIGSVSFHASPSPSGYQSVLDSPLSLGTLFIHALICAVRRGAAMRFGLMSALMFAHPYVKKHRGFFFLYQFSHAAVLSGDGAARAPGSIHHGIFDTPLALLLQAAAPLGICLMSAFALSLPTACFEAAFLETASVFSVLGRTFFYANS